jgi:starch synthase
MALTGLSWDYFTSEQLEYYGDLNILKGGIIYADAISTISQQYAREILTPEFGCGLDGLLRSNKGKLYGILNGVDYEEWNPVSDPIIASNFSAIDLTGKKVCKQFLLDQFHFDNAESSPLIMMISRLISQRGFDILMQSAPEILSRDCRIIVLGIGESRFVQQLSEFASQNPARFVFINQYDSQLAHKLIAGSDFTLMPSRYEPSGSIQLCSLRYGTIPIVRATGGLEESIEDFNDRHKTGYGFKFKEYSSENLIHCLERALVGYRDPEILLQMQINAMRADFSWNSAAFKYLDLYRLILKGKKA